MRPINNTKNVIEPMNNSKSKLNSLSFFLKGEENIISSYDTLKKKKLKIKSMTLTC